MTKEEVALECKKEGIPLQRILVYHSYHPEKEYGECFIYYKAQEEKKKQLKSLCEFHEISFASACRYMQRYENVTPEEAVAYWLNKKNAPETISQICKRLGIATGSVSSYMRRNPDKTREEAIAFVVESKERRERRRKEELSILKTI